MTRATRLATVALIRPSLRRRLGLSLSGRERAEVRALGAAMRASTPVLPQTLRTTGPAYLRWRRTQIAGGQFGRAAAPAAQRPSAIGTSTRPANARASASLRGPVGPGIST